MKAKTAAKIATITASLCLLAAACGGNPTVEGTQPDSGRVYLWIGADQDSYTRCDIAASCQNGDQNHPFQGELQVANEPEVELKRAYLHFPMPVLPAGAKVLRAHLEVFNGSTRNDFKSDDLCLSVAKLTSSWSPYALTWEDQPLDQPLGDFGLSFRSNAWTTADVLDAIEEHLADPAKNHGFAVSMPPNVYGDKGFYSLNAESRTPNDLGLTPRLLLEVELPQGADPIEWPSEVAADSDLELAGQDVVIARVAGGEDFPAEWEAAVNEDRCN